MTNYNERLDEILTTCDFEPDGFNSRICLWCGKRKGAKIHTAKQAITSLIKELVAEAKPRHLSDTSGYHEDFTPEQLTRITAANRASNEAVKQFEQNLLKTLEEV